jgi:MFS family permease
MASMFTICTTSANATPGYFYFSGIIAFLIGWFTGHFLHDSVGWYYTKRHAGRLDPEARLIITYTATIICCVSLIILGFAFQYHWHYMVIAMFAALQCIGVILVTTAISAYLLDYDPETSGEVGAWVTASHNWAGFMATYIQIDWVTRLGPAKVLGIQAAITFASLFFMTFVLLYGKRLRQWQGRMVIGKEQKRYLICYNSDNQILLGYRNWEFGGDVRASCGVLPLSIIVALDNNMFISQWHMPPQGPYDQNSR